MVCIDVFPQLKQDTSWCLFRALTSKYERWMFQVPLELRHYGDLSRHIKEPQNYIYCLNFLKMTIWKLRLFHTKSNLLCLVCRCAVSFLSAPWCILTAWTWRESAMACWTLQQYLRGAGLCEGSIDVVGHMTMTIRLMQYIPNTFI